MNIPKISVLMPIYRTRPEYLKEAIGSILSQTFANFELVILDDCPFDDRENIIKQYNDPRIRYYKNTENQGISDARNRLLELAKGEYLAVFDHDDISVINRLELQSKYLDEHPGIGVVSSQLEYFPEHKVTSFPITNFKIKRLLVFEDCVPHTAMMVRASILKKYNLRYESDYSPCEDYMLCLKLMAYTMFYNFPIALVKYRDYDENTSKIRKELLRDKNALCLSYSERRYSYYYREDYGLRYWVKVFDIIPLIKVKKYQNKTMYYLFGFLPFLSFSKIKKISNR